MKLNQQKGPLPVFSVNPGRPRGSRNRAMVLAEQFMAGRATGVAQKAVDLALSGNVRCISPIPARFDPAPKGRLIEVVLIAIKNIDDALDSISALN